MQENGNGGKIFPLVIVQKLRQERKKRTCTEATYMDVLFIRRILKRLSKN